VICSPNKPGYCSALPAATKETHWHRRALQAALLIQAGGDLTAGTSALVQRRRRELHLSAAPSR
jgi:hypothetical protein